MDFVWAALGTVGIKEPAHFPGSFLYPTWNKSAIAAALDSLQSGSSNGTPGGDNVGPPAGNTYDSNGLLQSSTITDGNGNVVMRAYFTYNSDGTSVTTRIVDGTGNPVVTSQDTFTIENGAAYLQGSQSNYQNGNIVGQQTISTTSAGQAVISASGADAVPNLQNSLDGASVTVAANSTINIQGSGNTVALASGDDLFATGGGEVVTQSGGSNLIALNGTNRATDTVYASGDAGGPTINGQSAGVYLGAGVQANVVGSSDVIVLAAGDTMISVGGNNIVVAGANELIGLNGTGTGTAAADTVYASGDALDGSTAAGPGTGIYLGAGVVANVIGSNDGIVLASGDDLFATGGGDVIAASGSSNMVALNGAGNNTDTVYATGDEGGATANGQGAGVYLGAGVAANVVGSSDAVFLDSGDTMGAYGGSNTIHSGAGDVVSLHDTGTVEDVVYANGDQGGGAGIYLDNSVHAQVYGSGDLVDAAGTGDDFGVRGGGNTIVSGGGNSVYVAQTYDNADALYVNGDQVGSGGTVTGSAAGIHVEGNARAVLSGNDDSVTVLGSGATLAVQDGGWNDNVTLNAAGSEVDLGNRVWAQVYGSGDTVRATGSQDDFGVRGGGNAIVSGGGNSIYVAQTYDNADALYVNGDSVGSGGTVTGSAAGIHLDGNAKASLSGSDDGVTVLGSGAKLTVQDGGWNDDVTLDAAGSEVDLGNRVWAQVYGSGDTVRATGSGDDLGVRGGGNTIVSGGGNSVYVGQTGEARDTLEVNGDSVGSGTPVNNETAGIHVDGDTQVLLSGSGDAVTVYGGQAKLTVQDDSRDDNVTLDAAGSEVDLGSRVWAQVYGNGDLVDAVGTRDDLGVRGGSNTIVSGAGNSIYVGQTGSNQDTLYVNGDSVGSGSPVNDDQAGIHIEGNAQASLSGSNDDVTAYGSRATITVQDGAWNDNVTASDSTVNLGNRVWANVYGHGDIVDATGTGDDFGVRGAGNAVISGGGNSVYVAQTNGSYDTLLVSGDGADSGGTVTGSAAGVHLDGNTQANLSGSNDDVGLGGGSYLGLLSGTGFSVNGSGSTIATLGGTGVSVQGSYDTVSLGGSQDTLAIVGGGNVVNAGSGDLVWASGTNGVADHVSASNDWTGTTTVSGQDSGIYVDSGAQATVTGGGDYVGLGNGSYVGLLGGTGYQVVGSGDTIATSANTGLSVAGSYDTVSLGGSGDTLGIVGGADTVSAGSGDLVYVTGTNGASDTVYANGDAFGGTTVTSQGTGIYLDNNAQANVVGSGDGVWLGTGDSLGAYGGGDVVHSGAADLVWLSGTGGNYDTVYANGDLTGGRTANGQGTGIYLDNNVQTTIAGSNDGIALGAGDALGVQGNGDTVSAGANDRASLVGDSDSYYGSSGAVGVTGHNEVVNASNEDVSFGANTTATGSESHDTIGFGAGDQLNLSGSYDRAFGSSSTVNFSGGGTTDQVTGPNDNGGGWYSGSGSFGDYDPGDGWFDDDPVILNLQGQAVDTQSLASSTAAFDMDDDGTAVRTGWLTAGEGMLVYDPSGAPVTRHSQLVSGFDALSKLAQDAASDAATDAATDAADGSAAGVPAAGSGGGKAPIVLDAGNPLFNRLRVWVDPTGDARFRPEDLHTLRDLGIASISLVPQKENADSHGNLVLDSSTYTRTDGTTGSIAGVDLNRLYTLQSVAAGSGAGGASPAPAWTLDSPAMAGLHHGTAGDNLLPASPAAGQVTPAGFDASQGSTDDAALRLVPANQQLLAAHAA